MKYAVIAARILLGLAFFASGLMKLIHYTGPAMPPSDATTMMTLMTQHGWMTVVGLFELIGGLLLLVGRYVPLGLVFLGPVIVNILVWDVAFMPKALPVGLACTVLELFLIFAYRISFMGLFAAAPPVEVTPL